MLLKRPHLPVGREFRQHMAERGLNRVSAAMKQHKRRMCGLGHSADSTSEVPDVHRGVSHLWTGADVSMSISMHLRPMLEILFLASALAGRTG
jgi:hypothetical protein